MLEKLLVVVYEQDLPQFNLMTYCLNKNWQGNKDITIIYQKDIHNQVTSNVTETFSIDWKVQCVNGDHLAPNLSGYDQQQVQKILYSIASNCDDVIVFDCKDFLLKPADSNLFRKGKHLRIPIIADSTFSNFYANEFKAFSTPTSSPDVPAILILTPWIWNVNQLKRYWNNVTERFGNITQWETFPPISELASYYYHCTAIDGTPESVYVPEQFMPTGGPWDGETIDQYINTANNFDKFPETVVWKHHRRISSVESTVITTLQLQKYGIPLEIISKWVKEKHIMLL